MSKKYLDKTGTERLVEHLKKKATTSSDGLMSAEDKTKLDNLHNYSNATTSAAGLMSASDKTKLDGVAEGAEKNQNAFSNIKVGSVTVAADSKTDTVTLEAGSNVTLTPDAASDKVTIAATDTTYANATSSSSGLMSSADKAKLDGIASGAEANVITGVKGSNESTYRTGNVSISKDNIGLSNVENKSSATIRSELTKSNVTTALGYTPPETDTNTTYIITQDANDGHKITLSPSSGIATSITIPDNDTTYEEATTSAAGLMSSSDKSKLNGISAGAEVNQNAFGNVKVGSTTLAADSKTDTLTVTAGSNITLTPDASADSFMIAAKDTTYSAATQSVAGLMSAADKKKLDGIAEGATASDSDTTYSISKSGSTVTLTGSDGSTSSFTDANTTYSDATTSSSGLMSASDKTKLNGVATGAEVNQNAFANVKVGSTTVAADSKTDTLELAAGTNITLTPDASTDKVTITAKDTTYGAATTSAPGLMSAADKAKLDGIEEGATNSTDSNTTYSISKSGSTVTLTGSDGTTSSFTDANTTYSNATTSSAGLMSAEDKTKLNGVFSGAEVNQNAFSNVKVGSTTVAADSKTDTLTLTAGSNVTITPDASNDAITIAATDTTYGAASQSSAGLMSAADKKKLDGIAEGATASVDTNTTYTLTQDSTDGHKITLTPSTGSATTITIPDNNTTYSEATTSAAGLMSSSDKTKLNGITAGAEVNQSAFSNVKVGSTTVAADSKTDTLELVAGSNVTLTPDATNDKVTIAAKDTTYSAASQSTAGLMSAADKAKLDGIEAGATNTVDTNTTYTLTQDSSDGHKITLTPSTGSPTTITIPDNNTTYSAATTSAQGLMSAADKTKLNGITAGAEINQNAFSNIKVGDSTVAADSKTDTLTLEAGSNVTLTPDTTNDKVTIAATNTNTTYSIAKSGSTVTLTGSDGSTSSFTDANTTYSAATPSANGLMSSTDKSKLDGIASGAEVNQNAFGNVKVGSTTIAADGKTDTLELVAGSNVTLTPDGTNDKVTIAATDTNTTYTLTQDASDGHKITLTPSSGNATTITIPDNNTTYNDATTSAHGLMTASDKTKLNGIATGAEVNQNAFSNVKVGDVTVGADSKTDTLTLAAGDNITLTGDATNDKVTIAATNTNTTYSIAKSGSTVTLTGSDGTTSSFTDANTTYSAATTSANGLMSSTDKSKLEGIASGAEVNQSAFSNVKVGSTTVAADSKTDTLELVAGSNVTLTPDATNDKVTIAATNTNTTYTLTQDSSDGHKITLTPSSGSATTITIPDNNTTYSDATTSAHGLMTAADKTKLNGIATGAEVNQSAFSNVVVGSTTIAADSKTDTLTLVAGSNVTLTPDASNDKVTIASTNTTYSAATASANGLMTSTDFKKINPQAIASSTDLNNITAIGWYHCKSNATAATLTHCPTSNAFYMEVKEHAGTWQHIVEYMTSGWKHYDRNYYNGTWSDWREWKLTDTNTTYSDATTSAHGLMTAADKTKLNGIASGAEVNQNAFGNVTVGSTTIAADGKTDTLTLVAGSNITLTPDATNDKITIAATDTNTTYSVATTSANGLMSSTDKSKLDGIASGAEVNQNAFGNVKVGSVTVAADGKTDTLELVAGSNVTLTGDATNDKVTIAATNTTYSNATTSAAGLMSASDKSKLDDIASGAQANQNAFSNVKVGSTTVAADSATDTLELVAGSNITLTPDATNDKVTIAVTGGNKNVHYGTCTTAASTAEKAVSVSSDFVLEAGSIVYVYFNNTNSASRDSLKLNVNSTGAAWIQYDDDDLPRADALLGGIIYGFVYDSNCWNLMGPVYSASSPISLSGTTFSHATSGVTAETYGTNSTTALTPGFGSTFSVPGFAVNKYGHVTSASSHTVKIPNTAATTSAAGLMSAADKTLLTHMKTVHAAANYAQIGNICFVGFNGTSLSDLTWTLPASMKPSRQFFFSCHISSSDSNPKFYPCVASINTSGVVNIHFYGSYAGTLTNTLTSSNVSSYGNWKMWGHCVYPVAYYSDI